MGRLALLVWLSTLAALPVRADDLDERIPVEPGGTLEVDLDLGEGLRPDRGELQITTHASDSVHIVADTTGWGAWDVNFRLQHDAGTVRLIGRVGGSASWLFGGPRIEVRIWVPRRFALDVRASGGGIRIDDLQGPVRARTEGGSIDVSGVEGPVRLRTREGDLELSEIRGPVDAKTTAGAIQGTFVDGGLVARTGDGAIEVSHVRGRCEAKTGRGEIVLDDVEGPVWAKTERGSVVVRFRGAPSGSVETRRGLVDVEVPKEAGATLEAQSRGGSVTVPDALQLDGERGEQHARGHLNGGGERLQLYSARGAVRVRTR